MLDEEKHIRSVKKEFRKHVLAKMRQNTNVKTIEKVNDLARPHIEGNQGYPQRYEMSPEEKWLKKRKEQEVNKANYESQIKEKEVFSKT